jgi:hypothetical protein
MLSGRIFRSTLQSISTKFSIPAIKKFQINPTNQETLRNSTLQSKRKVRRTLILGNSQERKKINLVTRKNLQEAPSFQNPVIGK